MTKSDFTACHDCRTRLYYRKRGYPSALEDDEYLRLLADGGFMGEYVAKAQFPGAMRSSTDILASRLVDQLLNDQPPSSRFRYRAW